MAFTSDGQQAAIIRDHGQVSIWQINERHRVGGFDNHGNTLDVISFSQDQTAIVTAMGLGSNIDFWRVSDGAELGWVESARSPFQGYRFSRAFAFSAANRFMATEYGRGSVAIWNVATRTEHHILRGHEDDVRCLAFAPDGQRLATGSADTTILIWPVDARVSSLSDR